MARVLQVLELFLQSHHQKHIRINMQSAITKTIINFIDDDNVSHEKLNNFREQKPINC